jgi:hypothetical protein
LVAALSFFAAGMVRSAVSGAQAEKESPVYSTQAVYETWVPHTKILQTSQGWGIFRSVVKT